MGPKHELLASTSLSSNGQSPPLEILTTRAERSIYRLDFVPLLPRESAFPAAVEAAGEAERELLLPVTG